MLFHGPNGITQPFFYFPAAAAATYPTPRDVLLNNGNIVIVTYVDDSLAKTLVDALASDTDPSNDYTPNPTWFTLPEGGGGGSSTPTDNPVPSPTLAPVDAPPSPPPQCGSNKATCQNPQDCCSGNCNLCIHL